MNEMPFIFDKIAKAKGKSVFVEMNTRSGFSFKKHTGRPDLFEKIKSQAWDYVVVQGFSRELSYDPSYIDTATMPYLLMILDSIYLNNPCTNVLLYETWGYKDGFNEREDVDTYDKMAEKIINGYSYLSTVLGLPIVPVGEVWREVRKTNPDIELYHPDNAHPSKNGSYLSASTFYAAIFKESAEGAFTSTISTPNALKIQKASAKYVLGNYDRLKLDMNRMDVVSQRTVDGKFFANCTSNFPLATNVTWEFGDGKKSMDKNPTHQYKEAGTYNLVLTVEDACGIRKLKKTLVFEPLKKPEPKPLSKPKKGNSPVKKI